MKGRSGVGAGVSGPDPVAPLSASALWAQKTAAAISAAVRSTTHNRPARTKSTSTTIGASTASPAENARKAPRLLRNQYAAATVTTTPPTATSRRRACSAARRTRSEHPRHRSLPRKPRVPTSARELHPPRRSPNRFPRDGGRRPPRRRWSDRRGAIESFPETEPDEAVLDRPLHLGERQPDVLALEVAVEVDEFVDGSGVEAGEGSAAITTHSTGSCSFATTERT